MVFQLLQLEQNKKVASKLYKATLAMFTLPILCYFSCQYILFQNNPEYIMYSGFSAVFMVNVVIFAYVWSAFHEEDDEDFEDENKRRFDNDENTPRVGAFKQRTD